MAKKRKRRHYDSYELVKHDQWVMNRRVRRVHDYEVDDLFINARRGLVNKRRRSRIGHVEKPGEIR